MGSVLGGKKPHGRRGREGGITIMDVIMRQGGTELEFPANSTGGLSGVLGRNMGANSVGPSRLFLIPPFIFGVEGSCCVYGKRRS